MSAPAALMAITVAKEVTESYADYQDAKNSAKIDRANAHILSQDAARKRLETSINEDREREKNRAIMARNQAATTELGLMESTTSQGVLGQQSATLEQNALDLRYKGIAQAESMDIQAQNKLFEAKAKKKAAKNKFYTSFLTGAAEGMNSYLSAGGTFGKLGEL